MSKIVDQPVLVVCENGTPKRFFWIKKWITVKAVIDKWNEVGRWWEDEKEKTFFRVLAGEGGVYELYLNQKHWNLYRVFD
ncbi:MAG: DUF6504 family protein [Bacillota bacterium]|jgi:hypothetical protein|nr:hypothetical protein [Candidatus Fermentithermobacillaceae bacterium]HOA71257.1 DUF6504 family protein [Bacillota bacterium]HPT35737.1 DUF6504 family protein [Bacillota bacterium]HPZ86249.1 DUF6504 family protein [Bacillota bacterium]HQD86227.1 DUF6504 family protein [Bacillota bacterium]